MMKKDWWFVEIHDEDLTESGITMRDAGWLSIIPGWRYSRDDLELLELLP